MNRKGYKLELDPNMQPSPVLPALIWGEGVKTAKKDDTPLVFLREVIEEVRAAGKEFVSQTQRKRVRDMLRYGKYKPSGRGKPASEFLLKAALSDQLRSINGPADVNNAISLSSGFPGSVFDSSISGTHLLIRHGVAGERYIFNPSGQTIDLEDVLVVCRRTEEDWEPCGNPVKDSMTTKIVPDTQDVVAVLYAPADEPVDSLGLWASRYAQLLQEHCPAKQVGSAMLAQN